MQFDKPTWHLKQDCPVCGLDNVLVLAKCPNCSKIIAECSEEMAVFTEIKDISMEKSSNTEFCPSCSISKIEKFILLSADEILSLGFTKDDYH